MFALRSCVFYHIDKYIEYRIFSFSILVYSPTYSMLYFY